MAEVNPNLEQKLKKKTKQEKTKLLPAFINSPFLVFIRRPV
jgi:hypothetical protein